MDLLRALFKPAADLYRAVVAQKATDLPGDLRHGIGRKLCAEPLVKALNSLEKTETAKLIEIVRIDPASKYRRATRSR